MMFPLPKSLGDLVLEVFDGGPTGFDAGFALPAQDNELGAPVTRVGLSYDVTQRLELVDELAHGLRAHVRTAGEFGEPRAGRVDLREHGRVRGLLGESRADDAVNDAEAERAVGLTQHDHRVGAAVGSYGSGTVVARLPKYQAAGATSADAAASIPHSRYRCVAQPGTQDSLGSPAHCAQTSCVQGPSYGRSIGDIGRGP